MKLTILPNGDITCLGDPPDWIDGERTTKRVSHILPVNPLKRLAFRTLRLCFGERGLVGEWTRHWIGDWECIIIGGTQRFVHPSRQVCIAWERAVLEGEG